jgi:ParB family chromosome partitioning protein
MPDIQNISLRHLELSKQNVRTVRSKEAIAAMAQSILANGVLQNLHVHTQSAGGFGVVIGGTRLAALQLLLKDKHITDDYQVACEVHPENDPKLAELSLAENVVRNEMNPADEFTAFSALVAEGKGPAEVGAQFGKTARYVQQRMRLAAVSPKLIAIYRKGEMSLDQLEAFTVEPDTRKQEKAWKALADWQKQRGDGDAIRAALTEQHVAIDSPFAKFIGLETYRASGGSISADLFDEDANAGYVTDTALLDRLVGEKLRTEAAKLDGEGWKWADAIPVLTYEEAEKYQRLHARRAEPSEEAQAEIAKLEEEATKLQEEFGDQPEDADAANRLDEIGERYNELTEGEEVWTPEQKAVAGVILTIGREGALNIRRGMVKPEDKAAARKLDGAATNGAADKPAKPKGGLPASLVAELTSHKTKAAQLVLSGNAAVALRAVTHALAIRLLYDRDTDNHTSLRINANEPTFPFATREQIDKSATGKKFDAVEKAWRKKLPKEPDLLWAWIEKQPKATVESLLAVCAALTVDVVQVNGNDAKPSSNQLTTAIKLDMAQFWSPTAANYLTRVPKKHLLTELCDAIKPTLRKQFETMKREPMGRELEKALKGKGWLPPVLQNE